MLEKKYYVIGTTNEQAWDYVHSVLTEDGSLDDNIPTRKIECTDLIEHSPTRSVYLMTDEEAKKLSKHPNIIFVHINPENHPELFPTNVADDLHCNTESYRYDNSVKNYMNFANSLPATPTSTDLNRTGYQLLRPAQFQNPWQDYATTTIIMSRIPNSFTGRNVDLVVGDDGCWIGHVEFQSNPIATDGTTIPKPRDYLPGNVLNRNATCNILDMVLDGPYYIDPNYFNQSPSTRLITRWDGTLVPEENTARNWWGFGSNRSPQFANIGTVSIPSSYTRLNTGGSNIAMPAGSDGTHGTPCAGLSYGRTMGIAYNANKWFIDAYGLYSFWPSIDRYFNIMKIFHLNKPINPLYGTRDPTVSSNSWGFRATLSVTSGQYFFRQGTSGTGGVFYNSTSIPAFIQNLGTQGDANRFKGEMAPNTFTTAGDELINSGVIFVVAAGNSNQQQVGSDHPNYDNYYSFGPNPLVSSTHTEFNVTCYNTTSRRGFPQQLGKRIENGQVVYPAINIGALDDNYSLNGQEQKVNYSDMGTEIDMYLPADGTLTPNAKYTPQYLRYDKLNNGMANYYDCRFSGTSAACPVAAGLIAAMMENNRSWTWKEVRDWIRSLQLQPSSTFYIGPNPNTATTNEWFDYNSLRGGPSRVGYITASVTPSSIGISGSLNISGDGLKINF